MQPTHALPAGWDKTHQPYNPNWSCPVPPKENRLKARIEAGEKKFKDDHE
jgi:uncharacterized protein (DUF1684 family)